MVERMGDHGLNEYLPSLKTFCDPMFPMFFSKSWVGVDEILCGGEGRAVGFWEDFPGQGAG